VSQNPKTKSEESVDRHPLKTNPFGGGEAKNDHLFTEEEWMRISRLFTTSSGKNQEKSSDLGSSVKTNGEGEDIFKLENDYLRVFGNELKEGTLSWPAKMFKEKLEYHLTKLEQSRLRKILEIYWDDRNVVR
jgi:hypothetical protein